MATADKTQRIDTLSLICALMVFLYIALRGFQLENMEFVILVILMLFVLVLLVLSHVEKTKTLTLSADREKENVPSFSLPGDRPEKEEKEEKEKEVNALYLSLSPVQKMAYAVRIVWRAVVRLCSAILRKHISDVCSVLFFPSSRDEEKQNRENFIGMGNGYYHTMVNVPNRVGSIIEPKLARMSRGFRGLDEDGQNVYDVHVGDGKQDGDEYLYNSMSVKEYYDKKEQFPRLLKSDEDYRRDKRALIEMRKEQLRRRNAAKERLRRETMATSNGSPTMVGWLAQKKKEHDLRNQEQEDDSEEGAAAPRKEEKKEDFMSYLIRKKKEMEADGSDVEKDDSTPTVSEATEKNIGWVSKKERPRDESRWTRDLDLSAETEEDIERQVEEEEKKDELKDADGYPLRFSVPLFKKMIREYNIMDYALCLLRTHDYKMFKTLMKLDWQRRYEKA